MSVAVVATAVLGFTLACSGLSGRLEAGVVLKLIQKDQAQHQENVKQYRVFGWQPRPPSQLDGNKVSFDESPMLFIGFQSGFSEVKCSYASELIEEGYRAFGVCDPDGDGVLDWYVVGEGTAMLKIPADALEEYRAQAVASVRATIKGEVVACENKKAEFKEIMRKGFPTLSADVAWRAAKPGREGGIPIYKSELNRRLEELGQTLSLVLTEKCISALKQSITKTRDGCFDGSPVDPDWTATIGGEVCL